MCKKSLLSITILLIIAITLDGCSIINILFNGSGKEHHSVKIGDQVRLHHLLLEFYAVGPI
jgi:uncharacterized protein YceK